MVAGLKRLSPVTDVFAEPPGSGVVLCGDATDRLYSMATSTVQTCVTSPPYFGLRDYGTRSWIGGRSVCAHRGSKVFCDACGAWYGELGQEPTVALYVEHVVSVMREVRRVLRDDGTLWLNLGDSYANDGKWGGSTGGRHRAALHGNTGVGRAKLTTGLKPKSLIGVPWRVALAMVDDGWTLRCDIVWSKTNHAPESVKDRPTRAHEYIFLFSKSERYFYRPGTNGAKMGGMSTHVVRVDETPATIAAKYTGDASRYPELVAANPAKARNGATFAALQEGEHLLIPKHWPTPVPAPCNATTDLPSGTSRMMTSDEVTFFANLAREGSVSTRQVDQVCANGVPRTLNYLDYGGWTYVLWIVEQRMFVGATNAPAQVLMPMPGRNNPVV